VRIDQQPPLPGRGAVITQVYSQLVASDIKISLLEIYPPEHLVTVVRGAGIPGEEIIESISLFELDRLSWLDHLTSLYVPEMKGEAKGDFGTGQADSSEFYDREAGEAEVIQVYEGTSTDQACLFPLDPLVEILARLRGEGGCPWDREQDHRSLRPYLLEESYEVLEAIGEGAADKI
jgi:tetrapyrrole methylase family protein/MazG family protein